jgi:hypothetical protein
LAVSHSWGVHEETGGDISVSVDRVYTVDKTETVTVPAGAFETYDVTGNGIFAGSPSEEELWWAPQVGAPVKMHIIALDSSSGRTLNLTFQLASR